ncbi:MAG: tetratricopeptide repeat protein [bacterium]|nr:tetratricopeptide repeat protein [bacterium]
MKRSAAARQDRSGPIVTSARQKILLMLFGLALFVLLVALVEGLLAWFEVADPYLGDDPLVGFVPGHDLYARKTLPGGEEVYATHPAKLAFFNAQEFPVRKAAGTYRIFALGGSTTAGRPYDAAVAFPRWLERYLEAVDPGRRYEVVNAGAVSYASYRIVVLLRELLRYEPDLLVVYTGHNEFLEERSYSQIIHQHPALKRLRVRLGGFRITTLARQGWRKLRPQESATTLPAEVTAKLDGWTGLDLYHRDDELRRSVFAHFEYNLRQIVAIARRYGVAVILVKPVANLKDFSPFKSEHARELSPQERERFAALKAEGRELVEAGRPDAALERFTLALELDAEVAELHYRIGRCHLAREDPAAARAAFVRAKDLDVAPLRAPERILELLTEIAGEYDVPLIDLPAILEALSRDRYGHGILGNEYLLDHVHPDLPVHSLIAERIIEVLIERGVVAPDPGWSEAKRQAIYDRAVAGLDRAYYAQRDLNLAKVLGWSGKLAEAEVPLRRAVEVLSDHPEAHLNLGIICQRSDRVEEAEHELRRALELDPRSAAAHFNLGVVLGQLGQPAAGVAALRRAIELRPDYVEAHYNLGALLVRQGSREAAISAFQRALELRPEAIAARVQLGLAYRLQGRWEEAAEAFRSALELAPDDATARTELGITYGLQGRFEEATRELEQAIAVEPLDAEAHYNLGVVSAQRGRSDAAIAAYERAVAADPGHARAHNNLGILYAGRGRLEEALRLLLRAVEIDPEYAEAYLNLGVVLDHLGRPEAAVESIRRALELDPENPRFHQALGSLYVARGEAELAQRHLEKAR